MASKEFTPTWLYIKQHSLTGLKYFGKCAKSEKFLLEHYTGSGKYWLHHIKKYGKEHVITIWNCLFEDKNDLVEFATFFSNEMDIVNATNHSGKKVWANLKPETGTDGGNGGIVWNKGISWTNAQKKAQSDKVKGVKKPARTAEHCKNLSKSLTGVNKGKKDSDLVREIKSLAALKRYKNFPRTKESIDKQSLAMKSKDRLQCPHFNQLIGGNSNFMRWHNNNCKQRITNE